MEAFVAKLFAAVSSLKAAYAHLQMAQFPFEKDAVVSADQSVVNELQAISELKHRFVKGQLDSTPPYVAVMLSEVEEQQAVMKIYEICLSKLHREMELRDAQISSRREKLRDLLQINSSISKKLISVPPSPVPARFSDLKLIHFALALNYAVKTLRTFAKLIIQRMESANWNSNAAVEALQAEGLLRKKDHEVFAVESFVCREIFAHFSNRSFGAQQDGENVNGEARRRRRFNELRSASSLHSLLRNPDSPFRSFLKSKYLRMIHPKMELLLFGNLRHRRALNSGRFPASEFFELFTEMGHRIWVLHCLAFSLADKVTVFEPKRNSRFSPVFMESVTGDVFPAGADVDYKVGFTVVPGFKIRRTVMQSRVYLLCARYPA